MARVVVLGSVNRDIVVMVPRIARPGETVLGGDAHEFPGGKGANQAVAARRMGADVGLFGVTGDDGHGREMRAFLRSEGIDLAGLRVLADVPTGIALIAVDPSGENAITVSPGANAHVDLRDVDALGLARDDVLVCQLEIPLATVEAAFGVARAAGVRTVLNPAPMIDLSSELLAITDILVLNEIELSALAGRVEIEDEADLIRTIRRVIERSGRAALVVVATLGAQGCMAVSGGEIIRVSGEKVLAIDATGAGDCFVGSLAAFLVKDVPLGDALRLANRAAAIAVTREGAAASMPTRIEVLTP